MAASRRHVLAWALLTVLSGAFWQQPAAAAGELLGQAKPAKVSIRKIDSFEIGRENARFGSLTFLGGIELISADRNIGGLSGLLSLDRGERILAVTDNGLWFAATIEQDPDGRPVGLSKARYTPLLGTDGKTLRNRWGHDTEALTFDGRHLFASAERANTIYRFPWPLKTGKERMIEELSVPREIKSLRGSKGLEALAAGPEGTPLAGTLVAIAERGKSEIANLPGFLIKGGKTEFFTVVKSDRYDATDAAFLPNGDLLLLERRFNLRDLVGMRLRRIPADELQPGALLSGKVLLEADYGYQIDNMEALAVHVDGQGRTILTLLSDNNRSLLQRTLLLRFHLNE
jgi:hypothetical protein